MLRWERLWLADQRVYLLAVLSTEQMSRSISVPSRSAEHSSRRLRLREVGRAVALETQSDRFETTQMAGRLRPVRNGSAFVLTSPPERGLVADDLAEAVETVFDKFAHESGFSPETPVEIDLARGHKSGSPGHGEGRALDIAAVGGRGFLEWKRKWDEAVAAANRQSDSERQAAAVAAEHSRNLGYRLYRALLKHGGWRQNDRGWRPYRGVVQLFGPWTATEGPWKALPGRGSDARHSRRADDQRWVFEAHQDHIHVAR